MIGPSGRDKALNRTEGYFEGARGTHLFAQSWMPARSPRALLAIVHGVTEHSDRYANLVHPMIEADIGVAAFDLRGHGRSRGRRGHVESWRDYLGDLERFLRHAKGQFADQPVYLYGHSLGSLIALGYVMEQPPSVAGVIVSGTAVDPAGVAKPGIVLLARLASAIWPTLPVPVRTAGAHSLSRDPKVEADFAADPWRLRQMTARWGAETLALVGRVKNRPTDVRLPILLLHGEADSLNTLRGAQEFFRGIEHPDKELKSYPGGLHEPHNDIQHPQVAQDVRQWIERRLM